MGYVNGFILTSPAGSFTFPPGTIMSHAKLVRDFITTMVVDPSAENPPRPERARAYVYEHMNGPAKNTMFTWQPN
jgi:hypothetical protein